MTSPRRDGEHASPFCAWIRNHPDLDSNEICFSVQDNDLWMHRFSERKESKRVTIASVYEHLQLVEVKTFSAEMPFAQRDTFDVIDKIIRKASMRNGRRRPISVEDSRRPGCRRSVRWLGVHVLQMSNNRPDNSERMLWDGKYEVSEKTLGFSIPAATTCRLSLSAIRICL
jgi:hypothetical protein